MIRYAFNAQIASTRLFVQHLVQSEHNETIKAIYCRPFAGAVIHRQPIDSITKGQ